MSPSTEYNPLCNYAFLPSPAITSMIVTTCFHCPLNHLSIYDRIWNDVIRYTVTEHNPKNGHSFSSGHNGGIIIGLLDASIVNIITPPL